MSLALLVTIYEVWLQCRRLMSHRCGSTYATQGMPYPFKVPWGQKAGMMAATVPNILGVHVLEFNRDCTTFFSFLDFCGFFFFFFFLPLSCVLLFFHPALLKKDPKTESVLHFRPWKDPENRIWLRAQALRTEPSSLNPNPAPHVLDNPRWVSYHPVVLVFSPAKVGTKYSSTLQDLSQDWSFSWSLSNFNCGSKICGSNQTRTMVMVNK